MINIKYNYIVVTVAGSARDVTHSITSTIQSVVNKCNNPIIIVLFRLYIYDNSQITLNAIHGVSLVWQV